MTYNYQINQIVKGQACGTFVILGFFSRNGENFASLKAVDPHDHTRTAPGELALPIDAIRPLH